MLRLVFAILAASCLASTSAGQSVRIDAGLTGQGYIFKQNGICWVLLPSHLLDETGEISVETSPSPSALGSGEAYADFWTGMDFAIGYVGQAAGATSCIEPIDSITQDKVQAGRSMAGVLRFVEPGGALVQYPMTLTEVLDHKTFVAEFTDPAQTAFTGLSGAFIFAQGRPIGMAIRTPEGKRQMEFIRIEEIAFATKRWLNGRARTVVRNAVEPAIATASAAKGRALTLRDYNTAPREPRNGPEGLATGQAAYHFDFTKRVRLSFAVENAIGVGVKRVRILSSGDGAKPLDIRIMIDATEDGSSPKQFFKGQMSPDGTFDTGLRGERFVRTLSVIIETVQGEGPVRVDQIIVE